MDAGRVAGSRDPPSGGGAVFLGRPSSPRHRGAQNGGAGLLPRQQQQQHPSLSLLLPDGAAESRRVFVAGDWDISAFALGQKGGASGRCHGRCHLLAVSCQGTPVVASSRLSASPAQRARRANCELSNLNYKTRNSRAELEIPSAKKNAQTLTDTDAHLHH